MYYRYWLPSLDFDEIQQLLHQELSYPTTADADNESITLQDKTGQDRTGLMDS